MKENDSKLLLKTMKRAANKLRNSKIAKKIAALTVSAAIAVCSFAACAPSNSTSQGNGTGLIFDSNKNNNGKDNNKDNTGKTEDTTPSDGDTDDVLQPYSNLIKTLFTDSYFKQEMQNFPEEEREFEKIAKKLNHPYSFFAQQGFDVNEIHAGFAEFDKKCVTYSFIYDNEPNNLYMATYVADSSNQIYHEYLLKYELTEHEIFDYKFFHNYANPINTSLYIAFFQSMLLNDVIAKTHTPTIISYQKELVSSHNKVTDCNNKSWNKMSKLVWYPFKFNKTPNYYHPCDYIIISSEPFDLEGEPEYIQIAMKNDHNVKVFAFESYESESSVKTMDAETGYITQVSRTDLPYYTLDTKIFASYEDYKYTDCPLVKKAEKYGGYYYAQNVVWWHNFSPSTKKFVEDYQYYLQNKTNTK